MLLSLFLILFPSGLIESSSIVQHRRVWGRGKMPKTHTLKQAVYEHGVTATFYVDSPVYAVDLRLAATYPSPDRHRAPSLAESVSRCTFSLS
jgi:hypothetical protein